MGERSITKLTIAGETVRSYLHWGSPEYQIPAFADFVYWAWSTSRPWTLATWRDFLVGVGDRLLSTEPSDAYHGDLEHYYRITISADGALEYAYRHRRLDAACEWTDWDTKYRADSRLGLYRLAEARLARRRRSIEYMLEQRPSDERAQEHLAWVGLLEQTAAVWQRIEQLPRRGRDAVAGCSARTPRLRPGRLRRLDRVDRGLADALDRPRPAGGLRRERFVTPCFFGPTSTSGRPVPIYES